MPLPNLTWIEWVGVIFASWTVLGIVSAAVICFAANRIKRIRARLCGTVQPDPQTEEFPPFGADPDDDVRWLPTLPPVPQSQRREPVCPLDLHGYELDAAYYAVIAPNFREYS